MNSVISELNNNLKVLYRQAIDADSKLDSLQKLGKGKFSTLFNNDSGFAIEAKRFKPYVLEVASEVEALSNQKDVDQALLKNVVIKMQLLHQLLASFK
ncbi:prephenate dehydrogenase [Pseudoalteromonas sp.]|uniref:prephenate dehydrogenase n=1 Tax=Pseudoalteromonas sp. TaxID=53249 RepID=UPI003562746B